MSRFNAPKERGVHGQPAAAATSNHHDRFQAAPPNAHIDIDSKDERNIANRLASAEKSEREGASSNNTRTSDLPPPQSLQDPLEPARAHGNEPSRGAKIDAEIQMEEYEELLRKKNV